MDPKIVFAYVLLAVFVIILVGFGFGLVEPTRFNIILAALPGVVATVFAHLGNPPGQNPKQGAE